MAEWTIRDTEILIADSLIAATALTLGISFVTKNQHHYRFIEGTRKLLDA